MYLGNCITDFTILVFSFVILAFPNGARFDKCDYPECRDEAKRLQNSIDESVDPCIDFTEFACGKQLKKFVKELKMRPMAEPVTTFRSHQRAIRNKLQAELNQPYHVDEHRTIRLAKIYWRSCKDTQPREAMEGLKLVFQRLGGWPLIHTEWKSKHFNWVKFSMCARILGFLPRMFLHIGLNFDNVNKPWNPNDTLSLTVERAKFMYDKNEVLRQMERAEEFFRIAKSIGGNREPSTQEIKEALEFGKQIYLLTQSQNLTIMERRKMSIVELQKEYPFVNWLDYIRSMLTRRQANYLSDRNCLVVETFFLSRICDLLKNTEKRVQANYAFLALIDDLFLEIRPHLSLAQAKNAKEVEDVCFKSVSAVFGKALDMIMAKLTGPVYRTQVNDVQIRIAQEAHNIFHKIPWMDHQTLLHTTKKLEKMNFVNVYQNDMFDDKFFDRLEFTQPDAILVVLRQLNIFLVDNYYLQIGRPRNMYTIQCLNNQTDVIFKKSFSAKDTSVTPEYVSNQVYVPAGTLGFGRFSTSPHLSFMNYAVIGLQIAVAISQHMYQKGSFVDLNSQWCEHSWWSQMTQQQFSNQQSCQRIAPLRPLDKLSTIFGYIGGAEITYKAMFNSQQQMSDVTLPGLNYTTRQLFWIAAVAADCDISLKRRYNMMVANNYNFTMDFNCSVGSNMNIMDKCKMWVP